MISAPAGTPRAVLDTNVVISALVFARERTAWMHWAWQSGVYVPLISTATAVELIRVLEYPRFDLGRVEREAVLAHYLPMCSVVDVPAKPEAAIPACRDVADRAFLELAVAGKADYLVSGDADLLAVASRFPIPIVAPARFRSLLERHPSAGERLARYRVRRQGQNESKAAAKAGRGGRLRAGARS